jgi:hypothetical protein
MIGEGFAWLSLASTQTRLAGKHLREIENYHPRWRDQTLAEAERLKAAAVFHLEMSRRRERPRLP